MRRLLVLAVLALSLAGCGNGDGGPAETSPTAGRPPRPMPTDTTADRPEPSETGPERTTPGDE